MENKGQSSYNQREVELIQELTNLRLESGQDLPYEPLDDYELPPRQQFPMLKKPTLVIKYGKMYCNMAAIRMFEGVKFVLPMVSSKLQRVCICPCREEEDGSVEWSRQQKKDGKWVNKEITCPDVIEKIYAFMGWERECRYKIHGQLRNSKEGLCLVFELENFLMEEPNKEEYVDPVTGETKKRQVKYYPDYYKNRIGRPYNDYVQARQMSLFEDTESYSSLEQMAAEDVPVAGGTAQTVISQDSGSVSTEETISLSDNNPQLQDPVITEVPIPGQQMNLQFEDTDSYERGREESAPWGGVNGHEGSES